MCCVSTHQTLRADPAMADIVELLEGNENWHTQVLFG